MSFAVKVSRVLVSGARKPIKSQLQLPTPDINAKQLEDVEKDDMLPISSTKVQSASVRDLKTPAVLASASMEIVLTNSIDNQD